MVCMLEWEKTLRMVGGELVSALHRVYLFYWYHSFPVSSSFARPLFVGCLGLISFLLLLFFSIFSYLYFFYFSNPNLIIRTIFLLLQQVDSLWWLSLVPVHFNVLDLIINIFIFLQHLFIVFSIFPPFSAIFVVSLGIYLYLLFFSFISVILCA